MKIKTIIEEYLDPSKWILLTSKQPSMWAFYWSGCWKL